MNKAVSGNAAISIDAALAGFRPAAGLANPHLQSILTSSPVRRLFVRGRSGLLRRLAEEEIIATPEGVRLQGFRSAHRERPPRGLAILLHGWEGSADSNYLLSSASRLYDSGFDIFRLNFRDHGDSHHLNEDLFHSCRLQEVADAVHAVSRAWRSPAHGDTPGFLAGF